MPKALSCLLSAGTAAKVVPRSEDGREVVAANRLNKDRIVVLHGHLRERIGVRGGSMSTHTHICTNHYKGYGMLHQRDVRKGSDLQR